MSCIATAIGGGLKRKAKTMKTRKVSGKGKGKGKGKGTSKKSKGTRTKKRTVRFNSVPDLGKDIHYLNGMQQKIINNQNRSRNSLHTIDTITNSIKAGINNFKNTLKRI